MNAAPNARHARFESQLRIALNPSVRAAGLFLVGQINVGDDQHDFRVPDLGVFRTRTDEVWLDDAAIVIEILSPHDESWQTHALIRIRLIEIPDGRCDAFRPRRCESVKAVGSAGK